MKKTNILWFRKNLRIHDNPTLLKAIEQSDTLVCVFIYDEVIHYKQHGVESLGPFRAHFLWESLTALKQALQDLGSDLLILEGDAVLTLSSLYKEIDAGTIFAQQECGFCENEQEAELAKKCHLDLVDMATLLTCKQLPFDKNSLPNNFVVFRRLIEQKWSLNETQITECSSSPASMPPIPEKLQTQSLNENPATNSRAPSEKAAFKFEGSEASALKRLKTFVWDTDLLRNYRDTCNELLGANFSSKLSPWIANGSLSVRHVYHEIRRFEQEHGDNDSTRWAICELLWRDFFHFNSLKHGASLFAKGGVQSNKNCKKQIDISECELVKRWSNAETGYRFLDACMTELLETGYLSNRGRQSVSAYFVKEMGADWRLGASWFEHILIDFEPCNNYGNWNFQSGIGHDVKKLANFSIELEGKRHDPDGRYQNYWLGED
ncbi:DASH family cryptochrome [Leucothrix sargassi]|nr:DASH family cryptochrome [Leucothrix sargassi]